MARLSLRPLTVLPLIAALLCGCTNSGLSSEVNTDSPIGIFDRAEEETGVPALLLMAISQAETRMQMVEGHEEFPGQVTGHGIMGLRGGNIQEGATLAGFHTQAAKEDRVANVLATAYLMAQWAEEEGINTNSLGAWANVVARYSGISDPEAAAEYVHHEVYQHRSYPQRFDHSLVALAQLQQPRGRRRRLPDHPHLRRFVQWLLELAHQALDRRQQPLCG